MPGGTFWHQTQHLWALVLKEILEVWAELNFQDKITSVDCFLSQRNYGIIHSLELWKDQSFIKTGINWEFGVNKVIKEASNIFLSPNKLENLYHTKVCPLTFCEVAAAVKTLWKNQKSNIAANVKEQEAFTNATLKSNNPSSRLAFQQLIEAKSNSPIPSQLKWSNATQDCPDFKWHPVDRFSIPAPNLGYKYISRENKWVLKMI